MIREYAPESHLKWAPTIKVTGKEGTGRKFHNVNRIVQTFCVAFVV